jgi:hypothetical protein
MNEYKEQLAKQRTRFEWGLSSARCPKDGGRVLETSMPNVVCEKCSSQYVLAVRVGFLNRVHWKLVEPSEARPMIKETTREKEVIVREVVLVSCKYCGDLIPQGSLFCPNCGARKT